MDQLCISVIDSGWNPPRTTCVYIATLLVFVLCHMSEILWLNAYAC